MIFAPLDFNYQFEMLNRPPIHGMYRRANYIGWSRYGVYWGLFLDLGMLSQGCIPIYHSQNPGHGSIKLMRHPHEVAAEQNSL